MENSHIASSNAEAVDGLHVPAGVVRACGPVVNALLLSGCDRVFEVGRFDRYDVDRALPTRLLTEDGECRDYRTEPVWGRRIGQASRCAWC